ncbi:hypothetical protein JRG42_01265 [Pseudomonas granadensis]|uniref:hypothetical protein n=1 Tax=Pseudomonas granadensis TaxID=1421430 RepID=UPI0019CFBD62|nr:hypothetical protein [Pseudomonas granadensis]MBN6772137.1 hypothetical protein [Pseudomonas granadensis]MBN6803087.1 hypothetical protein [Pseudomonas granadensis]MBN6829988.1 hypothetical protein [Pseudomonas granadensis]MBN6837308.1 hypothetical protein [Pseudomonas granadensis]MBN6865954.1 hypothetical protein [Pseudomonas granadensis]
MRHLKYGLMLSGCLGLIAGCAAVETPNSFTFVPDFPADFTYDLTAAYVPGKGETCSVPGGKGTEVGFNKTNMKYQSPSEIELYRTVSGCPLALNRVQIKIIGVIGRDQKRTYSSYDYASFAVRPELQERHRGSIDDDGAGRFFGECQWLFRTVGPKRYITKILTCKRMDSQGNLGRGHPFTAYTLTQLPGKTVELQIRLAAEEEPYMGDTWVKVPGGWKRCMGKGFEDQHAFCYGNQTDFSTFRMVDERVCTIYPSCAENKDDAP